MNILITSVGQRVSLIKAFKSELKKRFPDGKVFAIDMNPDLSPACQVAYKFFKVNRISHHSYISDLLNISLNNGIKMIIPTIDTELQILADHKPLFDAHGIHVIVSSSEFVKKCRDKRKINVFFEEYGIEIPKAIDKLHPVFPLFIKPYDGSLSIDTFLIKSPEDLLLAHLENEKFMFMEYISKDLHDEYTIDMYFGRDHYIKCIVPRKRITVRAGEINKGITCYNKIVPFLKKRLNFIPGARGCITMQAFFNKHDERIIAIEINPRFGGGYPLSFYAGANYPGYLIREYFNDETLEYSEHWEKDLLMLRYDDEILVRNPSMKETVNKGSAVFNAL